MTTAFLCFMATFVSVFALGLQSQNVNQGHYWAAGWTSILIGLGHIGLYKFMPGANGPDIAGYLLGGVTGITTSMWFHRSVKAWWSALKVRRAARACSLCGKAAPDLCWYVECPRHDTQDIH